jgi:hypothetical protein
MAAATGGPFSANQLGQRPAADVLKKHDDADCYGRGNLRVPLWKASRK